MTMQLTREILEKLKPHITHGVSIEIKERDITKHNIYVSTADGNPLILSTGITSQVVNQKLNHVANGYTFVNNGNVDNTIYEAIITNANFKDTILRLIKLLAYQGVAYSFFNIQDGILSIKEVPIQCVSKLTTANINTIQEGIEYYIINTSYTYKTTYDSVNVTNVVSDNDGKGVYYVEYGVNKNVSNVYNNEGTFLYTLPYFILASVRNGNNISSDFIDAIDLITEYEKIMRCYADISETYRHSILSIETPNTKNATLENLKSVIDNTKKSGFLAFTNEGDNKYTPEYIKKPYEHKYYEHMLDRLKKEIIQVCSGVDSSQILSGKHTDLSLEILYNPITTKIQSLIDSINNSVMSVFNMQYNSDYAIKHDSLLSVAKMRVVNNDSELSKHERRIKSLIDIYLPLYNGGVIAIDTLLELCEIDVNNVSNMANLLSDSKLLREKY